MNSDVGVQQCRTKTLVLGNSRSRSQKQSGIIYSNCWKATVKSKKITWDCITELTEHPGSLARPYLFPTLAMSAESLGPRRLIAKKSLRKQKRHTHIMQHPIQSTTQDESKLHINCFREFCYMAFQIPELAQDPDQQINSIASCHSRQLRLTALCSSCKGDMCPAKKQLCCNVACKLEKISES